MNKVFSSILFSVALMSMAFSLSAQNKFGHVNSAELLSLMPESKVADAELKKFGETLEAQLKTMHAEYQAKVQDYQSKESLMAESIKQTKQKEILDLEGRIQEFQDQGQTDIQKKKESIYSPILKKAQDAINTIAKEGGYTYIFDTSLGTLLYAQESNDIMPLVKKKMGLNSLPADSTEKKDNAGKSAEGSKEAPKMPVKKAETPKK